MASNQYAIPHTPRVISPSPTLTDTSSRGEYFGPVTRSAKKATSSTSTTSDTSKDAADLSDNDPDVRARTRSRSPLLEGGGGSRRRRMSGLAKVDENSSQGTSSATQPHKSQAKPTTIPEKTRKNTPNGNLTINGHLKPPPKSYWRELSRSPSPLGLIPIHSTWRSLIHRHELPRKLLHVSIGFVTLYLYKAGKQTHDIYPGLFYALVPITLVDVVRHNWDAFNRTYIFVMGSFMRESEVSEWNGVIFYLLGAFISLACCPKDIGVVSVVMLSWCDTAASTFGRWLGRYTPKVRRGKSLAGSIAAFVVGVGAASFFWGYLANSVPAEWNKEPYALAYQGFLQLPAALTSRLGLAQASTRISGPVATGVLSVVSGLIASASEAVDLFGWDDNLTIPVLCSAGLWAFLKVFGS